MAIIQYDFRNDDVVSCLVVEEGFTEPGSSEFSRFSQGQLCAQVSGTATDVSVRIERAAVDPAKHAANWVSADSTGFSGDASAGFVPKLYQEVSVGWWRATVSAISGGDVHVSISGEGN